MCNVCMPLKKFVIFPRWGARQYQKRQKIKIQLYPPTLFLYRYN